MSYSGMIDVITQRFVKYPGETWPPVVMKRKEYVIAPYFCKTRCGLRLVSPENINVYDSGTCEPGGKCVCNEGFKGNTCSIIECKCKYGYCEVPRKCICHPGYMGAICDKANCSCLHGICVRPFHCNCNSWIYVGEHCDIHIMQILLTSGLIFLVACFFIYFFSVKLIEHNQKKIALANTDWIVDWTFVEVVNLSLISFPYNSKCATMIQRHKWKEQQWYVNFIHSNTIDRKNEALILEMVGLVKLRHENVIQFGGACLVKPNVSLFVEFLEKGSLEDVLANEAVELGWDFLFSFMKDICRGMEFIHDISNIKSHGRLKSSNCLLDNRWTVRLTGFGAHVIRFGENRIPNEKTPEEKKELFWTAPELLKHVSDLDGIKAGTPPGDVYSFAIVTCEIITRASPYEYELNYLSVKDILALIKYKSSKAARRIWEDIGGEDMLYTRPIIKEDLLPTDKTSHDLFGKMIEQCWQEEPKARPAFSKIITMLMEIYPMKGELIDNLIHRLETYSSSLEVVVIERTKELEKNKATAEQ
ncbi:resact receptor, partial [Octopus bimaculoides]|uniref:resact receptor n=1 Tax=Octopus bimaculoides TaxID=37653 RepID=UPI00071DF392